MKLTNKTNIPLALAVWLATDEYNHTNDLKTISATSLLKPIKSIVLSIGAGDSEVDISELIQSKIGTALHSSVETAWLKKDVLYRLELLGYPKRVINSIRINPEVREEGTIPIYLERRSNKKIGEWTLTGQFDMSFDGQLYDIKSTGTYSYIHQSNAQKYIEQGSLYRYLNQDIITSDLITILYIFTDYSSTKAKQEAGYPKSRLLAQDYPLMSLKDTERFITEKLSLIDKYTPDPAKLPDCTSEELWSRESVFKYYKNIDKMDRSTKNFDTYWEAHQRFVEDGSVGKVVEVKGQVVYCNYCSARNICNQAKQYITEGRLIL